MGCQEGGGKNFDKRNVVPEPESLKAWVAKRGGGNFDKRNVVLNHWKMGCQEGEGGGNFDKRYLNLNH